MHDDCSRCNVGAIVQPYLRDERIRFERSPKRLGISGNWNACLARSCAPFTQLLFQDDAWLPRYLERSIVALHAAPEAAFCAANHDYRDERGTTHLPHYEAVVHARATRLSEQYYDGHNFVMQWIADGLHPNLIGEPSFVLMRTDAMRTAGSFAADLPQCLDMEYWTRLLMHGGWCYIGESLGCFRVHESGASALNEQSGKGSLDRFLCLLRLSRNLPRPSDRAMTRSVVRREVPRMIAKYVENKRAMPYAQQSTFRRKLPWYALPHLLMGLVRYTLRPSRGVKT